jgi:P27 family predicted phage terminase small subunit
VSARISDAEHKLKGTRPTRAISDKTLDIEPGRPKFPRGIDGEARVVFKQLVRQLEERRACTAGDLQILHLYAVQHVRWINARAKVADMGEVVEDTRLDNHSVAHVVLRKNPWLAIAQESERTMHAILRDLGLTPNARSKVAKLGEKPAPPKEASFEESYFADIDARNNRIKDGLQ